MKDKSEQQKLPLEVLEVLSLAQNTNTKLHVARGFRDELHSLGYTCDIKDGKFENVRQVEMTSSESFVESDVTFFDSIGLVINSEGELFWLSEDNTLDEGLGFSLEDFDLANYSHKMSGDDFETMVRYAVGVCNQKEFGRKIVVDCGGIQALVDGFISEGNVYSFQLNGRTSLDLPAETNFLDGGMFSSNVKEYQLKQAFWLGQKAVSNNTTAAGLDGGIMKLIVGRHVGKTPEGEASTLDIIKSWNEGNKSQKGFSGVDKRSPQEVEYIMLRIRSEFARLGEPCEQVGGAAILLDISQYLDKGWKNTAVVERVDMLLEGRYGEKYKDWFNYKFDMQKGLIISFNQDYLKIPSNKVKSSVASEIIYSFENEPLKNTMALLELKKESGQVMSEHEIRAIKSSRLTNEQKMLTYVCMGVQNPANQMFGSVKEEPKRINDNVENQNANKKNNQTTL